MKYTAIFYIDYEAEIEIEADNPKEAIRLAKEKYPSASHVPVKHWVGALFAEDGSEYDDEGDEI